MPYFREDRKVTSKGAGAFPREHLDSCSKHSVSKPGTSSNILAVDIDYLHVVPWHGGRRSNYGVFIRESNARSFSLTPVNELPIHQKIYSRKRVKVLKLSFRNADRFKQLTHLCILCIVDVKKMMNAHSIS